MAIIIRPSLWVIEFTGVVINKNEKLFDSRIGVNLSNAHRTSSFNRSNILVQRRNQLNKMSAKFYNYSSINSQLNVVGIVPTFINNNYPRAMNI